MIAGSNQSAKEIVDACRFRAQLDSLEQSQRTIFEEFATTAISEKFPGAILALPSNNSPTMYYAIAPKSEDWRKLRPLLNSYVGPTFSTFDGKIMPLDPSSGNQFEEFLDSKKRDWFVTTKIIPGDGDLQEECLESLSLMVQNYLKAPDTSKAYPKTTNQLIADFTDALNVRNRKEAENIIQVCKNLCRLDTPNLNFMRVKMYSRFNEWEKIINLDEDNPSEMPEFTTSQTFKALCNGRKTQSITSILLEAIYQTYFSHIEVKKEISDEDIRIWKNLCPSDDSMMLKPPIPKCIRRGGVILNILELHELKSKAEYFEKDNNLSRAKNLKEEFIELLQSIKYVSQEVGDFSFFLSELEPFGDKSKNKEGDNDQNINENAEALKVLSKFDKQIDYSTLEEAKKWLEKLEIEQREKLEKSELSKSSLQLLEEELNEELIPESWPELFRFLGNPEFKSYFKKLELAIDEWPVEDFKDSEGIKELNESLENIKGEEEIFYDRLSTCLPYLTSWLENDPDFPRTVLTEFYETLLLHIVLGVQRGKKVYESTERLISALLSLGLSKEKYKDLLKNCIELSRGIGSEQISWILDVLDATNHWPCPDENERVLFFNEIFIEIEKKKQFLSEGQILLINEFPTVPDWIYELGSITEDKKSKLEEKISDKVKTIAIYSLTESVLKRASNIIKKILPEIKVYTSNDKVGNPSLENFAKTADIFVVVTSSAKHAATEFIQKNRPKDKTTLFAAGKGSSSIIRALEEQYV